VAVSNAGRKRGRGKRVGRKKITDLNRGQMIGTGEVFDWSTRSLSSHCLKVICKGQSIINIPVGLQDNIILKSGEIIFYLN